MRKLVVSLLLATSGAVGGSLALNHAPQDAATVDQPPAVSATVAAPTEARSVPASVPDVTPVPSTVDPATEAPTTDEAPADDYVVPFDCPAEDSCALDYRGHGVGWQDGPGWVLEIPLPFDCPEDQCAMDYRDGAWHVTRNAH